MKTGFLERLIPTDLFTKVQCEVKVFDTGELDINHSKALNNCTFSYMI